MLLLRAFALLFLLLLPCATARDLVLTDGTILKNIRLREKTDSGIRVQHEAGLTFIDYLRLPEPERSLWGYEVAKYRQPRQGTISQTEATPSPTPALPESPRERPYRTQCLATTKKGTRCLRTAGPGQTHCYQHR